MIDAKQAKSISIHSEKLLKREAISLVSRFIYESALNGKYACSIQRKDNAEVFDHLELIEKFFRFLGYKVKISENILIVLWA